MGAIQNSINQALGVAAALKAPTKALKEQEERQAIAKAAENEAAEKREQANMDVAIEALKKSYRSFSQLEKPIEDLNMAEVQAYKAELESAKRAGDAASNQIAKSTQALYGLTGDPKHAKNYANMVSDYGYVSGVQKIMQDELNRRETDLLKAEEANKRAQEMQQAKKELKEQSIKKRPSYLDQPLSIGGKEIGTVRGLPKDMRSQVKEGMKNVR